MPQNPEEKDNLKKTEIMAAVTSGQKHVEIGSVILNGNNQYGACNNRNKIDLTALNGFEGRFSKNREELERNLAASDTGRQQRLRGIQASVGARIMNAEMKKVNQKAKADYDAKRLQSSKPARMLKQEKMQNGKTFLANLTVCVKKQRCHLI